MSSASQDTNWPPLEKVDQELAALEREAPDALASVFLREFNDDKTTARVEPERKPIAPDPTAARTETTPKPVPAEPKPVPVELKPVPVEMSGDTFQSQPNQSPRPREPKRKLVSWALGAVAILTILLVEAVFFSDDISRTILLETTVTTLPTDQAKATTLTEPVGNTAVTDPTDAQATELREPAAASTVETATEPPQPLLTVDIPATVAPRYEAVPQGDLVPLPGMPALSAIDVNDKLLPTDADSEVQVALADPVSTEIEAATGPEQTQKLASDEQPAGSLDSSAPDAPPTDFGTVLDALLVDAEEPAIAAGPATGLAVTQMVLTRGIADREPVDDATSFSASDYEIFAFARFNNAGAPTQVAFNWYEDNSLVGTARLTIGQSDSWRTWSKSVIHAGTWRVEITDESGAVMARAAFIVE